MTTLVCTILQKAHSHMIQELLKQKIQTTSLCRLKYHSLFLNIQMMSIQNIMDIFFSRAFKYVNDIMGHYSSFCCCSFCCHCWHLSFNKGFAVHEFYPIVYTSTNFQWHTGISSVWYTWIPMCMLTNFLTDLLNLCLEMYVLTMLQ